MRRMAVMMMRQRVDGDVSVGVVVMEGADHVGFFLIHQLPTSTRRTAARSLACRTYPVGLLRSLHLHRHLEVVVLRQTDLTDIKQQSTDTSVSTQAPHLFRTSV